MTKTLGNIVTGLVVMIVFEDMLLLSTIEWVATPDVRDELLMSEAVQGDRQNVEYSRYLTEPCLSELMDTFQGQLSKSATASVHPMKTSDDGMASSMASRKSEIPTLECFMIRWTGGFEL